ncbi:TIGR04283 family arsenosugar biosynthesis glycosyltransferase [Myxococcota bacterium]|nr:TIGR04283 family arsenosugar biosynthesis glycosyltransferase [Myxococcota bacterium]
MIPALDEGSRIERAIRAVRGSSGAGGEAQVAGLPRGPRSGAVEAVEIVVVDGGSQDDTTAQATQAGAQVIRTGPGRARQLEAGWRASEGDVGLFLHADTRLEKGWGEAIADSLKDPCVVGGAFRLGFDAPGLFFRVLEAAVAFRVRWLGLPYGDQGLFVRRRTLEAIGGLPDVPIMEDLDLVWAMRKQGRLVWLKAGVETSARRYLEAGRWTTTVRHLGALLLWGLGVDRARIVRWVAR